MFNNNSNTSCFKVYIVDVLLDCLVFVEDIKGKEKLVSKKKVFCVVLVMDWLQLIDAASVPLGGSRNGHGP